jgi:NADH-quinone oxidoreductase E subunit
MNPEFSVHTQKKIGELMACYPKKEAALLPLLHLIQREFGFISEEAEKKAAEILGLKPMRVREVVTFYTMFYQKPAGKYLIQACSNLSCTLRGAETLIDYLKKKLGIQVGETTADGKFTLATVECLGACEQAPCLMVNFDYYGNLTRTRIDEILEGLK